MYKYISVIFSYNNNYCLLIKRKLRPSATGYETLTGRRSELIPTWSLKPNEQGILHKAKRNVEQDKEKNSSQQNVNDWLMPQVSVKITQCCVAYVL